MKREDNELEELTLYDITAKKRKRYKMIAWISLGVLLIGGSIAMALGYNGEDKSALTTIVSGIAGVLLILSIVTFIMSAVQKNRLKYICPHCHNGIGVKVEEALRSEKGYVQASLNVDNNTANVKKVVTERKFDVTYECPNCSYTWNEIEDNYDF